MPFLDPKLPEHQQVDDANKLQIPWKKLREDTHPYVRLRGWPTQFPIQELTERSDDRRPLTMAQLEELKRVIDDGSLTAERKT